jgi:hypothetical protein
MASSQNGWPVAGRDQQDRAPLIRDVTVPNGVLAGDVAVVFRWLAREYDRRVERLNRGECWGWFVKEIEGSSTISNHASGTAVDFNAPDNPMGQGTTKRSMTAAQIATCHRLEDESGGVLRWGGDFSRNDPMHWEIVGTRAQVATLARKIKSEEKPAVTSPTPAQIASHDVDPSAASQSWGGAAWTTLVRTGYLANTWAPAVSAEINALQARIDDESDDLDAVGASIALLIALIGQVGNEPSAGDPNVWYDTMRLAVRDELTAQGWSTEVAVGGPESGS